jgi:peptidyl-prolyl cis-trans isomerase C
MTQPTLKLLGASLLTGLLAASAPAQSNTTASAGAPAASSAVDKMTELFGDQVIVKGKGFEIKRSQLDAAVMSFKSSAAARGQAIPPADMARVEQQLLQQIIRIRMLLTHATAADEAKGKEEGEKRLKVVIERAGSEENLVRQLKSVGIGLEELKKRLEEEAAAEAVVAREIQVTITDEEVRKYFEENPARFEEPEMIRVSHILLSTVDTATRQPLSEARKEAKRKQMDEILGRIKAGEDFAKLVREFSEDPGSKERGGEYTFPRGQMVPEFEAAAFALGENQVSDVVTSQFGYHIIKMLERIPAKKVEFAKVSDRIKEGLTQQAIQKQLPDYFQKLKKEEPVEILDPKLKPADEDAAPAKADTPK